MAGEAHLMAVARWGADCDVYIFDIGDWECSCCTLGTPTVPEGQLWSTMRKKR